MLGDFDGSNGQRAARAEGRARCIGLFHTLKIFVFIYHFSLKLPFNRCKSDLFFHKSLRLTGRVKFQIKTSQHKVVGGENIYNRGESS